MPSSTPNSPAVFKLFDVVESIHAHEAADGWEAVHAGQQGTIVHVFSKPSVAYEVEFANDEGEWLAMLALRADQLRHVPDAQTVVPTINPPS